MFPFAIRSLTMMMLRRNGREACVSGEKSAVGQTGIKQPFPARWSMLMMFIIVI